MKTTDRWYPQIGKPFGQPHMLLLAVKEDQHFRGWSVVLRLDNRKGEFVVHAYREREFQSGDYFPKIEDAVNRYSERG